MRFFGAGRSSPPADERPAVEQAAEDLDRYAIAAVGDVSNRLVAVRALARRGIAGCVFHEVLGTEEEPLRRAVTALGEARERTVGRWPTTDLAYSVAPHTLYTTHPAVVRDLVRAARDAGAVTSLHLAEHPGERRALEDAEGPVVDWLRTQMRGAAAELPWPRVGPVAHANALGALGPHILSVHVTDARQNEIELLAARRASVVLCPRSNLYIERKLPPLLSLLAAGLEVALGTDSLASNATLDVLAEARELHDRFPEVPERDSGADGDLERRSPARSSRPRAGDEGGTAGDRGRPRGRWRRRPERVPARARGRRAALGVAQSRGDGRRGSDVVSVLARLSAYGSLVTFSHTVFAMPFAASALVLAHAVPHAPFDAARVGAIVVSMVTARTSAMAFNRYVDRYVDAANPRTRARHIPTGKVSPREALALTMASGGIFLAAAATLGRLPALLAPIVLAVLLGYSYAKRFTWAAHAWLGVALALAPGGVWIAVGASPGIGIVTLMGAVVTWLFGFDVLYSLQDESFDRAHGLHSAPARFGARGALVLGRRARRDGRPARRDRGSSCTAASCMWPQSRSPSCWLVYEHALVGKGNLSRIDKAFFDVNAYVSLGFFALVLADELARPSIAGRM